MFRTILVYSRVTRKISKSVSSQEKWQFCCFLHFWPRDRRISNLKSRFSEWAPQVHPTDEVSGQKSDFIKKLWFLGSKSRIKLGQGFRFSQNSTKHADISSVWWTWGAHSEKRLFKFEIRLSRGQKCQKQQNCHFSWLETDFENFLVTLE